MRRWQAGARRFVIRIMWFIGSMGQSLWPAERIMVVWRVATLHLGNECWLIGVHPDTTRYARVGDMCVGCCVEGGVM